MIKVKKSEVASRLTGRFKAGCNGQTSKSRMLLQVRSMTEGARNAVLINIVVVSLALLCLAAPMNARPKRCLALVQSGRHLILSPNGMTLPVNNTVSIPAANNSMTA